MQNTPQHLVSLSTPDGRSFDFRLGAVMEYEEALYAILIELEPDAQGEEQLLIAQWSLDDQGAQCFEIVADERIISAVFERYVAENIADTLAQCAHDTEDGPISSTKTARALQALRANPRPKRRGKSY